MACRLGRVNFQVGPPPCSLTEMSLRPHLPLTDFLQNSDIYSIIHDFAPYWLPPIAARLGLLQYFQCHRAHFHGLDGGASPAQPAAGGGLDRRFPVDFFSDQRRFQVFRGGGYTEMDGLGCFRFFWFAKVIEGCTESEADSLSLLQKIYKKPVVPVVLMPPEEVTKYGDGDESWDSLRLWLDEKAPDSFFYVAFGTKLTLSQDQMNELASEIEKVIEGAKIKVNPIITGLETRVSVRHLVWVDWTPQKRILAHPSVGGLLTHFGWSSVIKGLGMGRALILFSGASWDQGLTARFLQDKQLGLKVQRDDRDGSFTSDSVNESIKRVMVGKEVEEPRKNAWSIRSMREIFGNVKLQDKYLDEFASILESDSALTKSA